ncbi:helix-turn-helix domain-containing protein [Asanoa sp. NPDC049518]|uniref:winged helix-turn-helix transcriptional regulator n=1 Tax=unclassified Asanoa TaxID=2685164 RepID=UPI00341E2B46
MSLILNQLATGPQHHGELGRSVAGASQKMLTQTLRALERDGLVARASGDRRVEYRLTALGESLIPVMAAVTRWAEGHIGDIDAARASFDSHV